MVVSSLLVAKVYKIRTYLVFVGVDRGLWRGIVRA